MTTKQFNELVQREVIRLIHEAEQKQDMEEEERQRREAGSLFTEANDKLFEHPATKWPESEYDYDDGEKRSK